MITSAGLTGGGRQIIIINYYLFVICYYLWSILVNIPQQTLSVLSLVVSNISPAPGPVVVIGVLPGNSDC